MDTLTRDAYIEALLGGRLFFLYGKGNSLPPAEAKRTYFRWAQLYARDRWRSVAYVYANGPVNAFGGPNA